MKRLVASVLAAMLVAMAAPSRVEAQAPDLRCDQEPGRRFFWVERAFCDLEPHGPEQAQGVIIWNHGIHGTTESWKAPTPTAFRLLQARGWDVIMLKRHHLAETISGGPLRRTVDRTLQEAAQYRKLGYRKVVVAGQSFGGYVSLEAADTSPDLFTVVAMAPGIRDSGASGALDPTITDRILQRAKVQRFALVFPKDDALFGNLVRGVSADKILARRALPYLLLDEATELRGHGGGTTARFAVRYGLCLAGFLSAPDVPAGRYTCPALGDDWPVARELLVPKGGRLPRAVAPDALPAEVRSLGGLWYGLLEDTLVLFALTEGPGTRAVYRWVTTRAGGGAYDATVKDGRVSVTFASKAGILVAPRGEEVEITWTSADGSRILKGMLRRVPAG